MSEQLQWGVVGTGGIAGDFVQALAASTRCRVVNVVGSAPEKGRAFASRFELPRSAGSLEEMLADEAVDAVYVATPHPMHEEHASAALEAGKAVLCEKPLTLDAVAAERLIAVARRRGSFLMEAFMYRCHPLTHQLLELLHQGTIGQVLHLRADFAFRVPRDPNGRLFDLQLGGGSILDVGGYPMSLARLIAGVAAGTQLAEPTWLQAAAQLGPTGADELATALVRFDSGFSAQLTCATRHAAGTSVTLFGERGRIELPDPWIPGGDRQSRESSLTVFLDGRQPEVHTVETSLPTYGLEAELVAQTLPAQEAAYPAMTWKDTLGNMRALDAWRAACEAPAVQTSRSGV